MYDFHTNRRNRPSTPRLYNQYRGDRNQRGLANVFQDQDSVYSSDIIMNREDFESVMNGPPGVHYGRRARYDEDMV